MKAICILFAASMVLAATATFAYAQDTICTIDVGPTIQLLLEAQSAEIVGEQSSALAQIAQAQRALLDIQTACGVMTNDLPEDSFAPFALTETYNAPNLYFSFDHPANWTVGSYSGATGYGRLSLTQSSAIENAGLVNGYFELVVGVPNIIGTAYFAGTSPDLAGFVSAYLDAAAAAGSSSIGLSEGYSLDGREAHRIGVTRTDGSSSQSAGIIIFLSLDDSERIVLLQGYADAGAELELLQLAEAIAVSVR